MAQTGSFSVTLGCGILYNPFVDGRELHIAYVLHSVTPPLFTILTHQCPLKTTSCTQHSNLNFMEVTFLTYDIVASMHCGTTPPFCCVVSLSRRCSTSDVTLVDARNLKSCGVHSTTNGK